MSLKQKIVLLTTFWLVGILIAVHVIVYFSFLRLATDNEQDLLTRRAEGLLQKVKATDLMNHKSTEVLQSYLPDDGMIRLLDARGKVLETLQADINILQVESEVVRSADAELLHTDEGEVLMVRLPVIVDKEVVGTLEMAEKLDALEENISTLISILVFSTFGAIGMSLIGGIYLSRWISQPISRIVRVMETIEQSLVFRKIPLVGQGKDELYVMASTFNRMMDRLEESFLRQQQFVSDASHEMKTPLTIIEGYAQMLLRWGLKDEKSAVEAVDSIYSEAIRMKFMTQQLLDQASSENAQQLDVSKLEIVSLCEETVELIRNLYKREIHIHSASHQLYLAADALKMRQILLILLDNAVKYSKGSIDLSVTEIQPKDKQAHGVEIRIKDYGIGIPQEELPLIFERFYRVDPSRHRKTGGAGLGLSIARNLVRLHTGTISIESEENVGTEVIVWIPSH
jgi:two-component system sensor histidine kinase ArlS